MQRISPGKGLIDGLLLACMIFPGGKRLPHRTRCKKKEEGARRGDVPPSNARSAIIMKKKFLDLLFSMRLSVIILLIVATASAVATFIGNDFGNESARALVYNAFWFEFLLFLAAVNISGSIYRFKMWKKEKWPIFVFHLSFVIILTGAGITRFLGYEGTMHIREGEASDYILSEKTYLTVDVEKGDQKISAGKSLLLSPLSSNDFSLDLEIDSSPVEITYKNYYHRAEERIVSVENGEPFVQMVVTSQGGRGEPVTITRGTFRKFGDVRFSFDGGGEDILPMIFITGEGDNLKMRPSLPVTWMKMADRSSGTLRPGVMHPFQRGRLYTMNNVSFVVKEILPSAQRRLVPVEAKQGMSGLIVDVRMGDSVKTVELMGSNGIAGEPKNLTFENGTKVTLAYGSRRVHLPFSVHLSDFVMQRYPGSETPSSYESHVIVLDRNDGLEMPYHIYMNHILVYKGYRFYQSSYDRDEKGTILSVAHDPGKIPTYIGYILMSFGFIIAPFSIGGRFRRLGKLVDRDRKAAQQSAAGVLFSLVLSGLAIVSPTDSLLSQTLPSGIEVVPRAHAERFGRLYVHDTQGRVKPMDTLTTEILNKTARNSEMFGYSSNQVVLSMIADPGIWQGIPLIKITNPGVKMLLQMSQGSDYAAFSDYFNNSSEYRLLKASEAAQQTPPSHRSKLDKAVLKADEMANITYMLYRGDLMRIFPIPGDENNRWHSVFDAKDHLDQSSVESVKGLWEEYLTSVRNALRSGDWNRADERLDAIIAYQKENAFEEHLPSPSVMEAEILFNRLNIFDRLTAVYLILGFVLLAIVFARIMKPDIRMKAIMVGSSVIIAIAFVAHTFGLGLRWYVSGHAPWSNGYESLIYITWATIFAGFIFARHSSFALSATSIVAGMGLFVAHLSWMDPQITNLVPVLKSYWLTIHVSVISASYGFLALGALLGFINLILFIMRKESRDRVDFAITEVVRIDEMTLMIGVALLSIGNILGAVWANESWGRYWSWDPKETWTLISMMVYAAILHFRFIPPMRSVFAFSVGSLLAFGSILMTYFGVNYYLTGMHSYAAGDPVPVPAFLYYSAATIAVVILLAAKKRDGKSSLKNP